MDVMDFIYMDFFNKFKDIELYISSFFITNESFLLSKKGECFNVKNSNIKAYAFHGFGCDFIFKDNNLDVEFENGEMGFTIWSFYIFAKRTNLSITEEQIKSFIDSKILEGYIQPYGKIFRFK
jgi:hypothetical protein